MSIVPISQLPQSTPLVGDELIPIVQGGTTKQTSVDEIITFDTNWGTIGGTLSNQTDLQAALDAKGDLSAVNANTLEIATKAPTTSPTFSGNVDIGDNTFNGTQTSLAVGENNTTSQNISIVLGNGNVLTATDAPSAAAGVTLYDSFDYPGGAYLKHQPDWDGPSGQSWRLTGTGKSLFFNQGTGLGLVTDGSKHIWCESQVQNYRNLDTTISAQTTYCTMLVRAYDTAPYDPDVNPNPGTGGVERVKFRIQFYSGTDASGNMRMNIGIDQGTLFASAATSGYGVGDTQAGAFEDDKTYLLAMKRTATHVYASLIEADGDPTTLVSEPNWQVTDSGSTGVTFQSISLFGNNTDPDNDRGIRVDELRIADNWEDVVAGLRYDEASKSIAIGTDNTIDATSDAIAIGKDNNLSGVRSYAMGEGLKDFGDDSTLLLGRYNEDPADDSKIVIANGVDDDDRFTAMEFKARTNLATNNSGVIMKALLNSPSYSNDSAASTGGVEVGELYRTGSTIKIRMA